MNETLSNLTKAFIGESQARNRYTYYASVAMKEGYSQIAAIFLETAEQEKTHAKREFEHITELKNKLKQEGETGLDEIEALANSPNIYESTAENLRAAIAGEHYEYFQMYPEFAETAEKEGFEHIAHRFRSIAKAEEHHEERFKKLLAQLEAGKVFEKEEQVVWVCRECGYQHYGTTPPEVCPSCDHPKSYYQLKSEEY